MAPNNGVAVALAAELPQYARFVGGTLMFSFEPEAEVQHPRYVADEDDGEGDPLDGIEELMLGMGTELELDDVEAVDEVCPNCHGSLPGTCSFCKPDPPVHVRLHPRYSRLVEAYARDPEHVTPEQFAIA